MLKAGRTNERTWQKAVEAATPNNLYQPTSAAEKQIRRRWAAGDCRPPARRRKFCVCAQKIDNLGTILFSITLLNILVTYNYSAMASVVSFVKKQATIEKKQ